MILTIDVGNTNIILGGVTDYKTDFTCRLSTNQGRTADEYAVIIAQAAMQRNIQLRDAQGVIISSVVPQLTPVLSEAMQQISGQKPLIVGPGVKSGLKIQLEDPTQLGADFVAAAVAVQAEYTLPCITIDISTATSIGVLAADGAYIGGAICPGVMTSTAALVKETSQLTHIRMEAPGMPIGRSTSACMKSGIIYGIASMIDGMISRFEVQLGMPSQVIATGDWAHIIIPHCTRENIVIDKDLVIRGLYHIYIKNRKR